MRWQYVDSPTHDTEPFDDANLTFGHVWNAGVAVDGLRPVYFASRDHAVIDGEVVYAIRYLWVSVEGLAQLREV